MVSAKEKDKECECKNRLYLEDITNLSILNNLDKDKRYEIWIKDKYKYLLEYIDSENRWYFFVKSVSIEKDENGNDAIYVLETSEENR